MKRLLIATTAVIAVVVAQDVRAATATGSMGVTANVGTTCTVSATPLNFLTVNHLAVTNAQATVTVTCTAGGVYYVGLDPGGNFASATRNLKGTGTSSLLAYGLFQDAGYSIPWGNTPGDGGNAVMGTGTGSAQALTVYGQMPSGQTLTADVYGDTVSITVTY